MTPPEPSTTAEPRWAAPTSNRPVDATIVLPGSKSITNRVLPLAAIADGPSTLRGALRSRDTDLMVAGLAGMGCEIGDGAGDWQVAPKPLRGPAVIDCGLAGTVARFLVAIAALADGPIRFDGDPRARERPMRPLIDALRQLGVGFADEGTTALPLTVHGSGSFAGGSCTLDASTSSQFISALLLLAPRASAPVVVRHVGAALPSLPHIAMTVALLRERGVPVDDSEPDVWRVEPSTVAGRVVDIEPDLSNAAPFLAAALVTDGIVRIPGWPRTTTQPGDAIRGYLGEMGARVTLDDGGLVVRGGGVIRGLATADLRACSELVPTIAALAALADRPTTLTGIGHMRGHETDRLAALAAEISRLGGQVEQTADGLRIIPKPLHGGVFRTYHDHRMATCGAVLGLAIPGVLVEDVATTAKTLPAFVELWQSLLA